ncbi:MAG: sodium:proton antiporter [Halobacteriales archaeon]
MIELLLARYYYVAFALLVSIGVYVLVDSRNLVKKVIGVNVFQVSVFLLLVAAAYRDGGGPAIHGEPEPYVNPLPHVLILTAIVVGVSLTALALALAVRVYDEYGTLDEDRLSEVRSDD